MNAPFSHPADTEVLLEARNISKSFPGVKALDGVGIRVRKGRLNALLGENGAGKSTLMNILSGVLAPDSGEIRVMDRPVRFSGPLDARSAGIAMIHQELNLVQNLSIAENIFLGREPRTRLGLVDYSRMNREAARLLSSLDMDRNPATPIRELRVGSQQVVEIARALSIQTRVLIMDEPTSAISQHEITVLFRLIHRLKNQGTGIIYITHKLDELNLIADDITVFRDGQFIAEKPFKESSRKEMVRLMVGRDLRDLFRKTSQPDSGEALRVKDLSMQHPTRAGDWLVRKVNFTLRRGEILGLFGLMGAGRTELLQSLFGMHPGLVSGQVWIGGRPVHIQSIQQAIRAGLALAPEDRKSEGLVLAQSIVQNTTLTVLPQCCRAGILRPALEWNLTRQFIEKLRIRTPSPRQCVRNLSGGNQQKVVLARWLATQPRVLLLDEPTRGIDINAKKEIYALVDQLAADGLSVLMVSSELPEIMGLADRILVMASGQISGEFSRAAATEEAILHAALPGAPAAASNP